MSFIRPEAQAILSRYRAFGIAAAIGLLAVTMILTGGLLGWVGYVLLISAAAHLLSSVQRLRFSRRHDGPGTIVITERQIAYFGPLTGGIAPLGDLSSLRLDRGSYPAHWVLESPSGTLHIPTTAEGAEKLFDVFAGLPGMQLEAMLSALREEAGDCVDIWQRPA